MPPIVYNQRVRDAGPGRCRVVVVDDSDLQCRIWRHFLEKRFRDRLEVETYSDPRLAVDELSPDVDLLLLDWEMPGLDGKALYLEACRRGVNPKRIIIVSSHPADRLHEAFDSTDCLAVIEKSASDQQAAFLMILDELTRVSCGPTAARAGAQK